MAPVVVGVGSGHENTLTFNRTIMLKDGTDYTLPPYPREEDIAGLRPIDPEIGILRIDRLDGSPLAVLYNFGTHLLQGSPQGNVGHVTADHVGVARHYLEDAIGGGVMAFFLQAAGGDVNEVTVADHNNRNRVTEFGTQAGAERSGRLRRSCRRTGRACARHPECASSPCGRTSLTVWRAWMSSRTSCGPRCARPTPTC